MLSRHGSRPRAPRRSSAILFLSLAAALFAVLSSAPALAAAESFTFAVIGDSGTGKPDQYAVAQRMNEAWSRQSFPLVVMLGDNLYGEFKGATSFRDRFEMPYAGLLGHGVRFRAVLGNHGHIEAEVNYKPFGMEGRRYYTFKEGDGLAQFFALDADTLDARPPEAAQVAWLETELKASTATWKIAMFHNPIYNAGRTHGPNKRLRELLEPLFVKHGVRLALSGHEHVYQRLKPRQGVAYFISGSSAKVAEGTLDRSDASLLAGNDSVCHFMLFTLTPSEAAFRAISAKGEVLDSGTLPLRAPQNQKK